MLRSLCMQVPLILLNICLFSRPARPATPLTYWVDSSCAAYPNFNAVFIDLKYMAATVLRRQNLGSSDAAFQWAFYNILKVHPGDSSIWTLPGSYTGTAAETVSWTMTLIEQLTLTTNQASSNLRIYCDDDPMTGSHPRWVLVPDIPGVGEFDEIPNSQRDLGHDQEFFDRYNFVRRNTISFGCQNDNNADDENDDVTQMEMNNAPISHADLASGYYANYAIPPDLQPIRSVLTICTDTLDRTKHPLQTWADIPAEFNFQGIYLTENFLETIVSAILGHEIMHMLPILTEDYRGDERDYGWASIMQDEPIILTSSAEPYMYLMILAKLENLKVRLSYDAAQAQAGLLVRDFSMPA